MKRPSVLGLSGVGALAIMVGTLVGGMAPAQAGGSTVPPWENTGTCNKDTGTPVDCNEVGTLALYNAQGVQIYSGSTNDSPLAAYAAATSADPRTDDTTATLYGYLAKSGVLPGNWSGEQLSGTTAYPNTAAPSPLNSSDLPLVTGASGDEGLGQLYADFPNVDTSTDAYAGMYQLRLYTDGDKGASMFYWEADVLVNTTSSAVDFSYYGVTVPADSWQQVYPNAVVTSTTTTLSVSPSTGGTQGKPVTLTATVSPAASGTVQFENNGTPLGSPAQVNDSTGEATYTFTPAGPASDSFTAAFTPTNTSDYSSSSTASPTAYTIVGADPTFVHDPAISGTSKVGATDTCKVTVDYSTHTTYAWLVNGNAVSGAIKDTFTIAASDYDKKLSCKVTASDATGTVSATSPAVKVALGSALHATRAPKLAGAHKVGKAESVSSGTWSPAATSYSYQWYLGSAKISGATHSSFKPTSHDLHKKIHVVVTAHKTGYANGVYTSSSVTVT